MLRPPECAQLSPNALGLDSARGEIGRDKLAVVSLKLDLPVMRRAASRQQFLQVSAELRQFSFIYRRATHDCHHFATPVFPIQRDAHDTIGVFGG
jgi:hypothetical protein